MSTTPNVGWEGAWGLRAERPSVRIAVGIGCALVAIGVEQLIWPYLPYDRGAIAVATLAVLTSAVFGGRWAGCLTTAMLALAMDDFWIPRHGGPADDVAWERHLLSALFVAIGLTITGLADWQQRARAAARTSEEWFRRMFDQNPLGTTMGDRDYVLLGVNRKFCEMLGYSEQELIGRTVASLTYPADRAEDVRLAARMWAEETRGYTRTKRYVRKDGGVFWAAVSVAAIRDEAGRQRYALGMIEDITGRKQMEEDLERSRAQAESAKEVAEAANRAKDQFLAVLSHELRTPLSPVLLTASTLEADPSVSGAVRDAIRAIRQNAEMEARLIDDLLDVTGIASGKLSLHRERVDVHALVGQAMYMVEGDVAAKRLRLRAELNAPCAELDADPTRLRQVFWNLLGNAVKFTPEGGEVRVRTACEQDEKGEWLVVEVRDTGEGIAADVLPRLFHAFEQGTSRTTRQFGGLGLGLTIARGIVEQHGGRIEAGSEGPGRGSTFTVRLPRRRAGVVGGEPAAGAAPVRAVETTARSRQSRVGDGRRLRILLVEDHPATRRAMATILSSLGHEVRAAGSLAEGLTMAEAGDVDLVVSDLALPDGSGHDLMRSLKGRRRELHGLAVSGYGREDDIRRSREAGFDEHLTKPVSRERLREALSHVGA